MITNAIYGFCMSIADSVPGVSGGTIAFIMGFYDNFIDSLHNIFCRDKQKRKIAIRYLLKLGVGWAVGMILCVSILSSLFTNNIYFMSSCFFGLTLVSIPFVIYAERDVIKGKYINIIFAVVGIVVVVGLTSIRLFSGELSTMDFTSLAPLQYVYLFVAGIFAITAMVLPGISGSTILLIAGVYLPTMTAAKQLLKFDLSVLPGILTLGAGVVTGVALSIHFIKNALKKHRSQMVYLIVGLMIGSLFAIVAGPASITPAQPILGISSFDVLGFAVGVIALVGLELLCRIKRNNDNKKRRRLTNEY